jgi:hypothetical protein
MYVGSRDSIGCFDSKMARKSALFPCPVLAGTCESCGDLALVESLKGLETASLWAGGLA